MLLLGGKGDCLASRVLLAYMCKHMGMKAEPCGKFEYHGETLVKVDGTYYIVITGFDEPRPRRYVITEVTDQSQLQKIEAEDAINDMDRLLVQLTSMGHSDGLFNKIDNVYEVIMNNSHEYYQKAKKENNDKIESLFYYIVNNQELLAKDRAELLLTGSVKVE